MTIAKLATIALVVTVAAPAARAQSVEAEVLFRDGKKLLKDGKIAEACEKLEASDHLESTVGTLLNLADCREKNHQLATAWVDFRKAAAAAKLAHDDKREAEAHRREKLLEPRLASLTIKVADANRVDGLTIARNDAAIDPALWNQGVPVDAGDYDIVAQAPGHTRWTKHVHVASEGQVIAIDVPQLESHAAPDNSVTKLAPPPTSAPAVEEEAPPAVFTPKRKLAVAVAAIGAAGIGAGIALGLHARNLEKQSDAICPTSSCNDLRAVQLNSDARSSGLYANIGYVAGGAAIAGAVVLWFIGAPSTPRDTIAMPMVAPDRVGWALTGTF
jgi:hypothetical protein